MGVIKSASQAAQAASSCCTLLQYCSQPWLARTTRSASILLRFSSFHQAPEIFSRFCMIERWAFNLPRTDGQARRQRAFVIQETRAVGDITKAGANRSLGVDAGLF